MPELFEIAYRSGGTRNCRWSKVLDVFSAEACTAKRAELERAGYASVSRPVGTFDSHGLPIGWTFDCVDYERDHLEYGKFHTLHIPRD